MLKDTDSPQLQKYLDELQELAAQCRDAGQTLLDKLARLDVWLAKTKNENDRLSQSLRR